MCDPVSITMGAISVASGFMQHQQAEAQADMTNARFEQNQENALASMRNEYRQTQMRQRQEQEATSQQIQERRRQEMQERATSSVAMGESGIQGFTVDSILRDISGVADRDVTNLNQNRDWNVSQLSNQAAGIQGQTEGRINSAPRDAGPSMLGTALQIGGGVANSYTGYVNRTGNDPVANAFGGSKHSTQGLPKQKLPAIQ